MFNLKKGEKENRKDEGEEKSKKMEKRIIKK